jgi:hypothetical protein
MGWVGDKFQNDSDFKTFTPQLWNAVRDSIGVAVEEFNAHTSDASFKHLEATDCTSMGTYCRRITRGASSIEVFLNDRTRTLGVKMDAATRKEVCGYRIKEDRTGAEFFFKSTGDAMDVEIACRVALEVFIFGSI